MEGRKNSNNEGTTIHIDIDVWKELNNLKVHPQDSFNEVVKMLLKEHEENREHEQAKKSDIESEENERSGKK